MTNRHKRKQASGRRPTARAGNPARRARALHRQAVVIDAQGVALLLPAVHLPPPERDGKSYIDRAFAAGLTALNTTLGQGPIAAGADDLRGLLGSIYGYLAHIELHPQKLVLVETADDILTAKAAGKLGVIFGVQGLAPKIEGDLTLISILHKLGLRVAMLTLNDRNAIGCGCLEPSDSGLTQYGRACVRELNRAGILVDVAHAGERTARDAIELSERPCIVSHANLRALADHPRNVTDEMLKALAENGGVIGVTAYAPFIRDRRKGRATIEHMIDHVAYGADLVGIDHVGIGSDHFEAESDIRYAAFATWFPGSQRGYLRKEVNVAGFERIDEWPRLTAALLRRGFSDAEVLKILGGNHLRVFRSAWRG
ncbi:MAG: dipeptidase [Dongiaceae bacterium]